MKYESYEGRTIEQGDKVKCYFDLHRHTFSIQKGSLVHAKGDAVRLTDCKFVVSEKLRQKVIKERRKNVHAKVHGKIQPLGEIDTDGFRIASYNPYKGSSFYDKETGTPLETASEVLLLNKVIYYK